MSAAAQPKAGTEPSPLRTVITIGTLAANFVTITKKVRRANGSPHVIDHVDLIASITTFAVLAVRARRGRETAGR